MMITMFENENLETVIPSFEDLSFEEMRVLQGAGEVQAETTPACAKNGTYICRSSAANGDTTVLTIKSCGK
jgi:type 2 lantibiotic (TIGR03893 family)